MFIFWLVMEYGNMDILMKWNVCVIVERIRYGVNDCVFVYLLFMMWLFNDMCIVINLR